MYGFFHHFRKFMILDFKTVTNSIKEMLIIKILFRNLDSLFIGLPCSHNFGAFHFLIYL